MSKTLCIYHGFCDDGFAAAWAVRHALGDENVEFYPGVYQKEPPDITGRDVVMVDFSYKKPVLDTMIPKVQSLLILDHHKSAAEDLKSVGMLSHIPYGEFVEENLIGAYFDMNRSGAGMAWDYFHPGQARPEFINYIEDRDLWLKKLPYGDEFTIALRSFPQDFQGWDRLVELGVDWLIGQGHAIQRYYRLRVEELKRSAYLSALGGYEIMVANAPYFAASEVAGELAEGRPFGASYFESSGGHFSYSLRSRDEGVDVSEIAKLFGGGGHRNAAGFRTNMPVHRIV